MKETLYEEARDELELLLEEYEDERNLISSKIKNTLNRLAELEADYHEEGN